VWQCGLTRVNHAEAFLNDSGRLGRKDSEASHPKAITREGDHRSILEVCVEAAPVFHLTKSEAAQIVDKMDHDLRNNWTEAAYAARLTAGQRESLWESSILNPAIYWPK